MSYRVVALAMLLFASEAWAAKIAVVVEGAADRAAELRLALEHGDSPTRAREERAACKRVHSAADDDRVVLSHVRARETRRP